MIKGPEIFLPTSCLAHRNSTVGTFGHLVDARRVRYRPAWSCAAFQRAVARASDGLAFWHPVKDTGCLRRVPLEDAAWRMRPFLPLPPPSPPLPPPTNPEVNSGFVFRRSRLDSVVQAARSGRGQPLRLRMPWAREI